MCCVLMCAWEEEGLMCIDVCTGGGGPKCVMCIDVCTRGGGLICVVY